MHALPSSFAIGVQSSSVARLQINFLSQAATLLVQVKAEQFKREIAAKNAAGKGKPKGGVKSKGE